MKIHRSPHIVYHQDDQFVYILDEKHDEIVTLDPIGAFIWNTMTKSGITLEQLIKKIEDTYEVTHANASKDVTSFVSQLSKKGFFTITQ